MVTNVFHITHDNNSKSGNRKGRKHACNQAVTKRDRLIWLINRALVYEPKCRGRGGGVELVVANEYSCTQEPK